MNQVLNPRRRVLIAPDKFKGTLSADQVAQAIAIGWKRHCPNDDLDLLPVSDGGDGFGAIVGPRMRGRRIWTKTTDAAHRQHSAAWWWASESRIAIIESATVIGMSLFVSQRVHPFQLDTFGLGAVLENAARRKATECIIGLGGSATNDGGFGLARALGWKFLDAHGTALRDWWQLPGLAKIIPPGKALSVPIIAAADVENRLLGDRGCSRVYGPQKGLSPQEVDYAEQCLARLAKVFRNQFNRDPAGILTGGAAGGLGFGLAAFTNAKTVSGFKILAKATDLETRIRSANLVITGEGRLDEQSLMGKVVGRLADCCKKFKVPCIAFAGTVDKLLKRNKTFSLTAALTDITSFEAALAHPENNLANLAEHTARLWNKN
jgi:glycerate kinase